MSRAHGRSWSARAKPADCRFVYLLKTLIPVFAALLVLQGIAQAVRALQTLRARPFMTFPEIFAVALVVAVCVTLMAGYPVAFTLGGVSLAFALLGHLLGLFDLSFLGAFPQRVFGVMTNEVLLAIPLFIFMGVMLERSRIAEDLLETMARLFGPLRGGLGISVVIVGVLLAAAKGVVGATVVTMGLIVLPAMLRFGYDKRLAAGTVAATATLAQIFPPATVLVLLGDQLSNAYQSAQLAKGIFAPKTVSVSDLFAGAHHSRLHARSSLSSLSRRDGDLLSEILARDAGRSDGAARPCDGAQADRSPDRAACAYSRRARLDPRRHRDADGSRLHRRGRRDPARRRARRNCRRSSARP